MTNNCIYELPHNAKRIDNSLNWIDPFGNLFGIDLSTKENYGRYYKCKSYLNDRGYLYGSVKYIIDKEKNKYKRKSCRINKLVAEAFIDNPNNYPIVGHKNNIKTDNNVNNLYWTTWQENTQKAYDDNLCESLKSYDNKSSRAVAMFDSKTNNKIREFGSIREASRITNISKSIICRQAKYESFTNKQVYFRYSNQ